MIAYLPFLFASISPLRIQVALRRMSIAASTSSPGNDNDDADDNDDRDEEEEDESDLYQWYAKWSLLSEYSHANGFV